MLVIYLFATLSALAVGLEPDVKLLRVAKLHESLFEERDVQIEKNSQNITAIRNDLTKAVKDIVNMMDNITVLRAAASGNSQNITEVRKTLKKAKVSIKTLQEENSSLRKNMARIEETMQKLQNELKSCVRLREDGRISQELLPGTYANFTLEDTQWQSLHLAAVAGCSHYWNGEENTGLYHTAPYTMTSGLSNMT